MAHGTRWAGAVREKSTVFIFITTFLFCIYFVCVFISPLLTMFLHQCTYQISLPHHVTYHIIPYNITSHYTSPCRNISRCIMHYYITRHYSSPYVTMPHRNIPYHVIQHTKPCHTTRHYGVPHHSAPYHTIPYHTTSFYTTRHIIHPSMKYNTLV